MTHRSQGRKKSNFPAQTTVISGSSFDFFNNGVNYKISDTDLYASLNVTGTIVQDGSVTGTPVLDTQGNVNNIRNLEDGSGVKSSVSPENGITLDHNFTFGSIGVPLTPDSSIASPVMRSLVAGDGIALAGGANSITITSTGTVQPTNTIIINQESDFPTQDATTITLTENNIFVIGDSFSTAKSFIVEQGAVVTMGNQFGNVLTYTGTGTMFTGVGVSATIDAISLSSPTATETFNFTDDTNLEIVLIRDVIIDSTPKWGTFNGLLTSIVTNSSSPDCGDGVTIGGSGQLISNMDKFAMVSTNPAFVGIDLGSVVIPNLEYTDLIIVAPAGATGISGLASNGNVPSGSIAKLSASSFAGGMTSILSGISQDDFRWSFSGNTGISDTRPDGLISLSGNSTETVIAAIDTPVKVAGTWTVESNSHFTSDATGRITYNGERPFTGPIDFSMSLIMASGGDEQITAYLAINGTVLAQTGKQFTSNSSKAANSAVIWQHTFLNNDFVECFVENNEGEINIIAQQGVGRVN